MDASLCVVVDIAHLPCRAAAAARRRRALSALALRSLLLRLRACLAASAPAARYDALSLALRVAAAAAAARRRAAAPVPLPCRACAAAGADDDDENEVENDDSGQRMGPRHQRYALEWILDDRAPLPEHVRLAPAADIFAAVLSAPAWNHTSSSPNSASSTSTPSSSSSSSSPSSLGNLANYRPAQHLASQSPAESIRDQNTLEKVEKHLQDSWQQGHPFSHRENPSPTDLRCDDRRTPEFEPSNSTASCCSSVAEPPAPPSTSLTPPSSPPAPRTALFAPPMGYQRRTYYKSSTIDERRCPVAAWADGVAGNRKPSGDMRDAARQSARHDPAHAASDGDSGRRPCPQVGYGMFRVDSLQRLPAESAGQALVDPVWNGLEHGHTEPLVEPEPQGNYYDKVTAFVEEVAAARKAVPDGFREDRECLHAGRHTRRTFFQPNFEALQSIRLHDNIFEIGADGRIRQQRKIGHR